MFSADEYAQMRAFFAGRPELAPTPLRELPALARDLGIGRLFVKDESGRFGLNAFKLLGARFAVDTLLKEGAIPPGATLVCASEGPTMEHSTNAVTSLRRRTMAHLP